MAVFSEKNLREAMERQLEDRGAGALHFRELVDSYLYFYGQEKKMRADVKTNGFYLVLENAKGEPVTKENPCVKNAALYNKQRLAILKELGITTESLRILTEDGEDL